jgi:hypothetical protein
MGLLRGTAVDRQAEGYNTPSTFGLSSCGVFHAASLKIDRKSNEMYSETPVAREANPGVEAKTLCRTGCTGLGEG